jgi:hypothetical protein
MSQVLSTLSNLEKSHFEAFRRSTLPGNAVRDYIAHLLLQHNEHLVGRCTTSSLLLGTTGYGMGLPYLEQVVEKNGFSSAKRPLHDLVKPGDADSIVVVVSALAKAYAQRLTTAARRVADALGHPTNKPLQPEHIQQAHHARVQAGLDPGFFLQKPQSVISSSTGKIAAAALGRVDRHDLLRQAALQAQEDYDHHAQGGKTENEQNEEEDEEVSVPCQSDPVKTEVEKKGLPPTPMEVGSKEDEKLVSSLTPIKEEEMSEPTPIKVEPTVKVEEKAPPGESSDGPTEGTVATTAPKTATAPKTEEKPAAPLAASTAPSIKTEQPAPKSSSSSEPTSMEDALLNDLDDDSATSPEAEEAPVAPAAASTAPPSTIKAEPPAPKPSSSGPTSMEDALLDDLDDDSATAPETEDKPTAPAIINAEPSSSEPMSMEDALLDDLDDDSASAPEEAPVVVAPIIKAEPPAPKSSSAEPMSMEDALLNDLDDDSDDDSDDDDV